MNLQTCLKYKYPKYFVRMSHHAFEQIKQKQSHKKFKLVFRMTEANDRIHHTVPWRMND
jgi:hypothetical protein